MRKFTVLLLLTATAIAVLVAPLSAQPVASTKTKYAVAQLARVEGEEEMPIQGYGVVYGLNGSGDSDEGRKTAGNLEHGYGIPKEVLANIKSGSIAYVRVRAIWRSSAKENNRIDVDIQAASDAKSLKGGVLAVTYLKDGQNVLTYAIAEGKLRITSDEHPTTATIMDGGIIVWQGHSEEPGKDGYFNLILRKPDISTAVAIVEALNEDAQFLDRFDLAELTAGGEDELVFAECTDPRTIRVKVPEKTVKSKKTLGFINSILDALVPIDEEQKIVIDLENQSFVWVGNIAVQPCMVSYKSTSIAIPPTVADATTGPAEGRVATLGPGPPATNDPDPVQGTPLARIAGQLNAMGYESEDIIQIILLMKQAGAIKAPVEIR